MNQSLKDFLFKNKIDEDDFLHSGVSWEELCRIAQDHENNRQSLNSIAEYCAKLAHLHPKVHSIRWRVKDSEHLKAKIIRKNIERVEKYKNLTVENYKQVITDLVGIRILHLYKDDFHELLENLKKNWHQVEDPVAYIRGGDNTDIYNNHHLTTKVHVAGYRSVHYIFSSSPSKENVIVEAQIRTIFEEGWSEIDHNLRYPNYQPNSLTEYFLTIFNRLAGSADEMGYFVNRLEHAFREQTHSIEESEKSRLESQKQVDELISKLDTANGVSREQKDIIKSLKKELKVFTGQNLNPYESVLSNGLELEKLYDFYNHHNIVNDVNKFQESLSLNSELRRITEIAAGVKKISNLE